MTGKDNDKGLLAGYDSLVKAEINFSKATGYDKELTAVVPLAELARREEDRLRKKEWNKRLAPEKPETEEELRPEIPVGEIVHVLRAAKSVEEVAGVLVEIFVNLVPRILLLWERNGLVYGFASRGMGLEEVKLLTIEMPISVLQDLSGTKKLYESYQGPPRRGAQIDQFYQIIGGNPPEILIFPVFVTTVDRWFLYADNENKPLPPLEKRLLEVIVSRAGAKADQLLEGKSW